MKIHLHKKQTEATKKLKNLYCCIPENKSLKHLNDLVSNDIIQDAKNCIDKKYFKAKSGEILEIFPSNTDQRIFLVGIKKEKTRSVASSISRKTADLKQTKSTIIIPEKFDIPAIISGVILGNYHFKLTGETDPKKTKTILSDTHIISEQTIAKELVEKATNLGMAQNFTRKLIDLPPGHKTPDKLEKIIKENFKGLKNPVKIKVLDQKKCEKLGMGALVGVGQGSAVPPRVLVFEYNNGPKGEAPMAFVGKGVTFDSGGYNIKPTGYMEDMKMDMGGSATVAGIFDYLAKSKPAKNIVGVIGIVENMVSSDAQRPGDVVTAMNGKTIEITNTDAEGRLVLADCLHYCETTYKPTQMIDFATLTGAVIVALDYEYTGIMGDAKVIKSIQRHAKTQEEKVWELPLCEKFEKAYEGVVSDLVNSEAGRGAGSSKAGAFLKQFVTETPWAHCDIAGTAYDGKYGNDITKKGATGVLVRTMCDMIENA